MTITDLTVTYPHVTPGHIWTVFFAKLSIMNHSQTSYQHLSKAVDYSME